MNFRSERRKARASFTYSRSKRLILGGQGMKFRMPLAVSLGWSDSKAARIKASVRLVFPQSASPYEDGRKSAHGPKQGEEDFLFENNFSVASPI